MAKTSARIDSRQDDAPPQIARKPKPTAAEKALGEKIAEKIASDFPGAKLVAIRHVTLTPEQEEVRAKLNAYIVEKFGPDAPPLPTIRPQYFAETALIAYDKGWMPMAQDQGKSRAPKQRPGLFGNPKTGGLIRPSELALARPKRDEVQLATFHFMDANCALVFGPDCGKVFAYDVDVMDPVLCAQIVDAIEGVVGKSRLRRVGKAPKIQLYYRAAGEMPPCANLEFWSAEDDTVSDPARHMVEVLSTGKAGTAFGTHWEMKAEFKWLDLSPLDVGPEACPEVNAEQHGRVLDAIWSIRKYKGRRGGGSRGAPDPNLVTDFTFQKDHKVHVPWMRVEGAPWRFEAGEVVRGREKFLFTYAGLIARSNPGHCTTDDGVEVLINAALDDAGRRIQQSGRKWSRSFLINSVKGKVRQAAGKVKLGAESISRGEAPGHGTLTPIKLYATTPGFLSSRASVEIPKCRPSDGMLDWLGTGERVGGLTTWERQSGGICLVGKPVEIVDAKADRAIKTDRTAVTYTMSSGVSAAVAAALQDAEAGKMSTHLVLGPTGGGKSTIAIRDVITWAEAHPRWVDKKDMGPIVVVIPTHANGDELRDKALTGTTGVTFPDKDDPEAFAQATGVRAMQVRGKLLAGCLQDKKMRALTDAGISSAGLCRSFEMNPFTKEIEEDLCEFDAVCPVKQQLRDMLIADILIVPDAFLTLPTIPSEMRNARLVIADESKTFRLAHTAFIPLSSFDVPRKRPYITKEETEAGITFEDLERDHKAARDVMHKAWHDKVDPEQAFRALPDGRRLVTSAKSVCTRAHDVGLQVKATMTLEQIEDLARFRNSPDLFLEGRAWTMILARMDAVDAGTAKGSRDYFLQHRINTHTSEIVDDDFKTTKFTGPTPGWRLSWRTKPNWASATWILLDASADERIARKLFPGTVVEHDIPVPLNVRVMAIADKPYSTSSFAPGADADEKQVEAARALVDKTRSLISLMAAQYGWGDVFVSATKRARERIFADWEAPANVDHRHLGALRGLDGFKDCVAALCVGRTEMPLWMVDGYAAAFSADDDVPEEPYDQRGDGLYIDDEGKEHPLFRRPTPRTIPMRSGYDVTILAPEVTGEWGRLVECQWRDEEGRQAIGRVRPVFRPDTPDVVLMTSCIPHGTIIDEMLSLDDLMPGSRGIVWDAIRRAKGLIDAEVTPACADPEHRAVVAEAVAKLLTKLLRGFRPLTLVEADRNEGTAEAPVLIPGIARKALLASWWRTEELAEDAVRRAFGAARIPLDVLASVVLGVPNRPFAKTRERKPDKLQAAFGTADEIIWREEQTRGKPPCLNLDSKSTSTTSNPPPIVFLRKFLYRRTEKPSP